MTCCELGAPAPEAGPPERFDAADFAWPSQMIARVRGGWLYDDGPRRKRRRRGRARWVNPLTATVEFRRDATVIEFWPRPRPWKRHRCGRIQRRRVARR